MLSACAKQGLSPVTTLAAALLLALLTAGSATVFGEDAPPPIEPEKFVRLSGSHEQMSADLGPLAELVGKWVGSNGQNLIAVPALGSTPNSVGAFKLLVQRYTETITFTPVGAKVRNRGGSVDQYVGALEYNLQITNLENGEVLHVENGMWLYLGNIQPDSRSLTPNFTIARSATIPHGDSVLALGNSVSANSAPTIPNIDTRPPDIGVAQLGYLDPYDPPWPAGENWVNPNALLQKRIQGQKILRTTTLTLDTLNADVSTNTRWGGIHNIPFIKRHANATRFQGTFWIETVQVPNSNQTYQQLQYSQNTSLEFHKKFSKSGTPPGLVGLITWPHVNINTLLKQ